MKQALIVWGGWAGHEPEGCAKVVARMLKEDGFTVVSENTTEAFADPKLKDFSLIVPVITMSTIEKEELNNLTSAVQSGVGLAGFHGQMGDSFRAEPDYQFMVGGQWVAHPGKIIDYTVNVTKSDDPVMQGITDFPYRSEQYYMHVDPSNEVLATTRFSGQILDWIDGTDHAGGLEAPLRTGAGVLQLARPCRAGIRGAANGHHPAPRPELGRALNRFGLDQILVQAEFAALDVSAAVMKRIPRTPSAIPGTSVASGAGGRPSLAAWMSSAASV